MVSSANKYCYSCVYEDSLDSVGSDTRQNQYVALHSIFPLLVYWHKPDPLRKQFLLSISPLKNIHKTPQGYLHAHGEEKTIKESRHSFDYQEGREENHEEGRQEDYDKEAHQANCFISQEGREESG